MKALNNLQTPIMVMWTLGIFSCASASSSSWTTTSLPSTSTTIAPSPSTNDYCVATAASTATSKILLGLRGGAAAGSDSNSNHDAEAEAEADGTSTRSTTRKQTRKQRGGKANKKSSTAEAESMDDHEAEDGDAKDAINEAMKESDAATVLGDAIRNRAKTLRQDTLPYSERTFDAALVSLGLSLGTAGTDNDNSNTVDNEGKVDTTMAYYQYGHRNSLSHQQRNNYNMEKQQQVGGVQPSTSAVIANYFLKTHGGTHVIQCVLSMLSSLLGVACLLLPSFPCTATNAAATTSSALTAQALSRQILLSTTKYQLLQQTLLLALAKHAAGFLGAIFLGASRIPELGLRNTRRHLEMVAMDPIGQYLFYCSILVVWMSWFGGIGVGGTRGGGMNDYVAKLRGSVNLIMNSAAAAAAASSADATTTNASPESAVSQLLNTLTQTPPPWYLSQSRGASIIPFLLLGPILLREIISICWVISDVLTLAFTSSGGMSAKFMQGILAGCRSVLDAFMSILISSDKWRKADSFQRQRSLAKLVSQCSLGMELCVGGILIGDAIQAFWRFAFIGPDIADGSGGSVRLPFKFVLGKMVCAHLYLNFLLSRRRKIQAFIGSIRGGAILDRVLDVLIDPKKEMGLDDGMEGDDV